MCVEEGSSASSAGKTRDERRRSTLETWHQTSEQFIWRYPDITAITEEVHSSILVVRFPDGHGRVK